jgi:glucose/arabinose dehydrogenase
VTKRLLACVLSASMLLAVGCGTSGSHSTGSDAARGSGLVAIGDGLRGPAGLKATTYGQGPKTLAGAAFDAQGRLWLTAAGLSTHGSDGVYVIAKPGATAVKVVSGLDDPLGLVWYRGKLYVASVGRVDVFAGFNGRRFASRRRIVNGPVAGGENNLLTIAPNGRFVMGVTASCDHCSPTSPLSGSIVSFRPDGGDLRLYAKRIRAPFGLTYFPGTNDLIVSMNQRDDLGARTPGDWLALVRPSQDWRFPTCYGQGGEVCAGVPAPIAVLDKHAAAGGVAIVTGQLGSTVGTAALVAEWAASKVLRVSLTKSGSTYKGASSPFLAGVKNPLALVLAPDHALLVGDWTSGRIYRVGLG